MGLKGKGRIKAGKWIGLQPPKFEFYSRLCFKCTLPKIVLKFYFILRHALCNIKRKSARPKNTKYFTMYFAIALQQRREANIEQRQKYSSTLYKQFSLN